jgi:hypothetical protein
MKQASHNERMEMVWNTGHVNEAQSAVIPFVGTTIRKEYEL